MSEDKAITTSKSCLICGDGNATEGYGIQSCGSCRIFFRRSVNLNLNKNKCPSRGFCEIKVENRHQCRYCRYEKCLSVGMTKDALRAQHGGQGGKKKQRQLLNVININRKDLCHVPGIRPLDLLSNDRSLLSTSQWSLISNIINSYNIRCPILNISQTIESQSIYPLKTRFKLSANNVMNIVGSNYLFIESFIKIIPEYVSMNLHARNELIKRNLQNLGGFNCVFSMRETNILNYPSYSHSLLSVYGSWIFNGTHRIAADLDIDGILIKLFLIPMAFTTCSDIVSPIIIDGCSTKADDFLLDTKNLFEIQNIYVELMFKYMIYRYGYFQASLRFASIMKNFLFLHVLSVDALESSAHDQMIKTVSKEIDQLLFSEN